MRTGQWQLSLGSIRAIAALACMPLFVSVTVAASPSPSRMDTLSANHRADPLLAVDMNRAEIVDRLMTQWQADIAANQREGFKAKLAGLRADRLLAVSLVGSFEGVLKVLYGQEQSDTALAARSALTAARSGSQSKALGDADRDLVYTPLSPCRLFDTRTGQPSALGQLGGTFTPNTGRNIVPAGACAIPASAVKNLFVSLTTLNNTPGSGGYITLLAPSAPVTTTTDIFNVNSEWSAANSIVTTGTAGQFVVYVATANAEVVVDVLGYFAPPPQPIGDITEVNTGTAATTGLVGGATSGIASLTLAPTFKLPQSCTSGQVPKFNTTSSLWECQNDNAGSGTVTSVTAGTGLTGGTITASGTIAADTTFLQRRVSSSCSAGSFITAVAADGTVTCGTPPAGGSGTVTSVATGSGLTGGPITTNGTINLATTQRLPTVACAIDQIAKWSGSAWVCAALSSLVPAPAPLRPQLLTRTNIDGANTGLYSSTTIGVDGFPIIAYYDQGNLDLKVAHCEDIQCSTSTTATLDSAGDVGRFPSIVIATNGLAVISYYDQTNGALKIAFCADIACSAASVATVDNNNNVGQYSSITVAANGRIAISYYDATTLDLKLAVCAFGTCTTASTFTFSTVDSVGDVGKWSSIAFGNTNTTNFSERMVIAYFDNTNKAVKLAFCGGSSCSSPTFAVVESLGTDSADGISMQLGQNNAPILSYYKRSSAILALARIAVCDTHLCAAPFLRSGGSGAYREQLSSITVGADGMPIAAFGAALSGSTTCDTSGGGTVPRIVRCFDATCSALSAAYATQSLFAQSLTMTIGVDGIPFMAGQSCNSSASTLGTLHCSDGSCALGYRRR